MSRSKHVARKTFRMRKQKAARKEATHAGLVSSLCGVVKEKEI